MAKTADNKIPYTKPFLTHEQQIAKLKENGMAFADEARALAALKNIGYYRLSGYWFPFQQVNSDGKKLSQFAEDTCFEEVLQRYRFDEKLRALILTALAEFEISLRAHWAYYFAQKWRSRLLRPAAL